MGPGIHPGPFIAGGCGTDQSVRWKVRIPSVAFLRRGLPLLRRHLLVAILIVLDTSVKWDILVL